MIGGKGSSMFAPVALGAVVQNSTYGTTIPVIYGRTKQALSLIWSANLRMGSSSKKAKKILTLGKKGGPEYVQNVDFLMGTNPIVSPLQFWYNQNQQLPLVFTKYSAAISSGGGADSITVPDSKFYQVIGVTYSQTYSETFDDYGGQGPVTQSGSWEVPMWNSAFEGPDITDASGARNWPFTFFWSPGSGPEVFFPNAYLSTLLGTFNIYYAQLATSGSSLYTKSQSGTAVPALALRLLFESQLGDQNEYDGYETQRIVYPHYAGLGSADLDLGSAQTIPYIAPETLGSFPFYQTGDCDFADMAEDIFKGAGQAGFGGAEAYTQVQHGLGCYNFPGCVQKKIASINPGGFSFGSIGSMQYDLPNTAGNFLVVICYGGEFGTVAPTDAAGNTWETALTAAAGSGLFVFYAQAKAAPGGNVVSFASGLAKTAILLEVGGCDTFDLFSATIVQSAQEISSSITTTGTPMLPEYILSVTCFSNADGFVPAGIAPGQGSVPAPWRGCLQLPDGPWYMSDSGGAGTALTLAEQTTFYPGTFPITVKNPAGGAWVTNVLLAFKCSQPPSYAAPLGGILDQSSLDQVRLQCRANGLFGSLCMDSQQSASDWLTGIYKAMNAAPVWAGFNLLSIPMSEVSAAGNGAVYVAPTASGPVAQLIEDDFVVSKNEPPVTVSRKAQVDIPNLLQIQHPDRASAYNDVVVSQPEAGSIALYGPRKDSPQQMRMIQDPAIARLVLGIEIRRQNYLRNTFKFKLKAASGIGKLLLPMDLITIPTASTMALSNPAQGGVPSIPVRLTSISEDDKYNLDCEAEPFIYGCNAPLPLPVTAAQPYLPQTGESPGDVNTPIIFEPVARLCGIGDAQVWMVVSGANANFGGCLVYLSTDGGSSYNVVGTITGSATTGVTVNDWPIADDPDTTNDLELDLTESNGTLLSYQTADRDNFVYPCYVDGGGASPIPYELMTYNLATMTAAFKYTLAATGSGNELRRAVFGAPDVLAGVDHPIGSRFAFLGAQAAGSTQPGILAIDMDPTWIGKTLKFKFAAFNNLQGALQATTGLTVYSFTPAGIAQAANPNVNNYSQSPSDALSNPTSTTIAMSQVTVDFQSSAVNYNARTFTIPTPGAPVTYYVTIADPNYFGDTGSMTNLTATCSTSQALCGVAGNTYIGSIVALPTGSGTFVTPGGWPPPQLFTVNGT